MAEYTCHQDIIDKWPSRAAMARAMRMKFPAIQRWYERGIPERHWHTLTVALSAAGYRTLSYAEIQALPRTRPS